MSEQIMSDQEARLVNCFRLVFPTLTTEEILQITAEADGIWDSLSGVTLLTVVQEEFNVDIDADALEYLNSFAAFRDYLLAEVCEPGAGS
jgi:acyl carrier protein